MSFRTSTIYSKEGVYAHERFPFAGGGLSSGYASISVDVNDDTNTSTLPYELIQINACFRPFTDNSIPDVTFKDSSGTAIGAHYKVASPGSTTTTQDSGYAPNTSIPLTRWGVGNYAPTPSSTFSNVEMCHLFMTIKFNRNSTNPISRVAGYYITNQENTSGSTRMNYGSFYLYGDSNPYSAEFKFAAGNISGKFMVWGYCGESVD